MRVLLVTERGREIEVLPDVTGFIVNSLPHPDDKSFPMLRFVDPYGDTYFNQLQMEEFMPEWARIMAGARHVGQREVLEKVKALAEKVIGHRSNLLKFEGD